MVPALCSRIRVTTTADEHQHQDHQVGLDPGPTDRLRGRSVGLPAFDVLAPGHHPGHREAALGPWCRTANSVTLTGQLGGITSRVEEAVGAVGGLDADQRPGLDPGQGTGRRGRSRRGSPPRARGGGRRAPGGASWPGSPHPPTSPPRGPTARPRAGPGAARPGSGSPRSRRRRRGGPRWPPVRVRGGVQQDQALETHRPWSGADRGVTPPTAPSCDSGWSPSATSTPIDGPSGYRWPSGGRGRDVGRPGTPGPVPGRAQLRRMASRSGR